MKLILLVVCILGCALKLNASLRGRWAGGMLRLITEGKKECRICKTSTEWFEQKLDHFQPSDTRTWQQKYYINDEFYNATAGGPAFLFIVGEAPADGAIMETGQWVKNGDKFGALLFQLEHRYYGDSKPTEDLSMGNLKYLSSEQALADMASFIVGMNEKYSLVSDVKWIVFGGSYAGNLAAWSRSKYPHLVHGAVASSAPILAEVDFHEYLGVVYEALKLHSDECVIAVKEGVDATDFLLTYPAGIRELNSIYQLCEPFTEATATPRNLAVFYEQLVVVLAEPVQYNNENIKPGTSKIDSLCSHMLNETYGSSPIRRLAHLAGNCVNNSYDALIEEKRDISYKAEVGGRQWTYQTCTEFGYFLTTNNSTIFNDDQIQVDYWIDICNDAYDTAFNLDFLYKVVDDTNTEYGQLDIEVTRTVFVHGSLDPWHTLGILETRDSGAPVIVINGTSHGQDMISDAETDLPQLTEARQQITELIASWLETS